LCLRRFRDSGIAQLIISAQAGNLALAFLCSPLLFFALLCSSFQRKLESSLCYFLLVPSLLVIPAEAGIQPLLLSELVIPAKAGIQCLCSFLYSS
jgi:hypothetical protein